MSRSKSPRLEFIESLRLLAALLVFIQHLTERYREIDILESLTRLGPGLAGVVIFFMVSGYVVPMSVRGAFDPVAFMVRRVFRVYPLLIFAFALLLLAGTSGLLEHWAFMAGATPFRWAANLLLVQDFVGAKPFLGVTWTLAIEFAWYSLFAVALMALGHRAGRLLNVALPAILVVLAIVSLIAGLRIPLGRMTMIYACVLGYQAFLFDRGSVSRTSLMASAATFLAVTWFTTFVSFGVFTHPHVTLIQAIWPWTIAPMAFFAVVLFKPLREAKLLNSGLLPAWGAASYSIYLLHPIGIEAAVQYLAGDWQQIVGAVAITAVMAVIGYRFVEVSGVRAGRRFLQILRRPTTAAPLPAAP